MERGKREEVFRREEKGGVNDERKRGEGNEERLVPDNSFFQHRYQCFGAQGNLVRSVTSKCPLAETAVVFSRASPSSSCWPDGRPSAPLQGLWCHRHHHGDDLPGLHLTAQSQVLRDDLTMSVHRIMKAQRRCLNCLSGPESC